MKVVGIWTMVGIVKTTAVVFNQMVEVTGWCTAQGGKAKGFECIHRSVSYCKQCSLVWSCIEERGQSCIQKGIRF